MRVSSIIAIASFAVPAVAYAPYAIPSFDLDAMTPAATADMVAALRSTGIMAIKNIPGFERIRYNYLHTAAECASTPDDFDELLSKELTDGTQRRTLSTNTAGVTASVATRCPAYASAHQAYTHVLDDAIFKWAAVLDGASNRTASSLTAIARKGSHLDHFHGYSNPVREVETSAMIVEASDNHDGVLSLELHEDSGLAIFTSAPLFFDKQAGNDLVQVPNPDVENTGLIIDVDGVQVRPVLKPDELVVMAGQGFASWGDFGHDVHPVLHGMVMPRDAPASVVRAFSGRMLLLEPDQQMANTGMTFRDYSHAVTRHLLDQDHSIATLACPVGRVLTASDGRCTLGIWVPGEGSTATKAECMKTCNNQHLGDKCKEIKCIKTGTTDGVDCWMVCVPHFTPDECPAPGQEQCKGQDLVCKVPNPLTPAPTP
ncbi:hypothetical protein As57867_003391, partial [Aphanomyces stellatus]